MQFVFGAGVLVATQQQDAAGNAVSNPTPVQFGVLQDVSADMSFEEKYLYGSKQFPIAFGRGKGKFDFKAKLAAINGAVLSDLLFGQSASNGIRAAALDVAGSVPGSGPYTVTPTVPSSGTWLSDLGVKNASTGLPLKQVASGPTTGQYSVSAGVYTFAAADTGVAVLISFEYSATSTTSKYGTIANQLMGYAPTFGAILTLPFSGKTLQFKLNRCIASKLGFAFKNDDFSVPDFDFTAIADAADNIGYWATSE